MHAGGSVCVQGSTRGAVCRGVCAHVCACGSACMQAGVHACRAECVCVCTRECMRVHACSWERPGGRACACPAAGCVDTRGHPGVHECPAGPVGARTCAAQAGVTSRTVCRPRLQPGRAGRAGLGAGGGCALSRAPAPLGASLGRLQMSFAPSVRRAAPGMRGSREPCPPRPPCTGLRPASLHRGLPKAPRRLGSLGITVAGTAMLGWRWPCTVGPPPPRAPHGAPAQGKPSFRGGRRSGPLSGCGYAPRRGGPARSSSRRSRQRRGAMGRPGARLLLPLLLGAAAAGPCFDVPPNAPAELDLTNRTASCPVLDWAPLATRRSLLLAHNGIGALPPDARAGPALEVLDLSHNELRRLPDAFLSQARQLRDLFLQHNRLRELPAGFLAAAPALQRLRLEGNPLTAVPAGALPARLRLLALPCRCDAVGSALGACACRPPACEPPACRCLSDRRERNASDFHEQQCRGGGAGLVGAGVGAAAGLLVLVLAAVAVVLRCRGRGAAAGRRAKRDPPAAPAQPRYVSRAAEPESPPPACLALEYENVFVGAGGPPAWQRAPGSPPAPADDDYFLESTGSAGDQPIYANTQGPCGDDDVYVMPDE
ncbi:uncharacterized protein LOC135323607 [Dromaius novaehollandiae]|uniref:uncharacterized protein LOC135323607 n=1 Tax=Dromaius novaehollandiae TaxID=8790 RepID=UPI00311F798B